MEYVEKQAKYRELQGTSVFCGYFVKFIITVDLIFASLHNHNEFFNVLLHTGYFQPGFYELAVCSLFAAYSI
jgi:hypothetical protein